MPPTQRCPLAVSNQLVPGLSKTSRAKIGCPGNVLHNIGPKFERVLNGPSTDPRHKFFNLDIHGIAVSGGSACSSGVNEDSHVLSGIGADMERPSIRISFSKLNNKDQIDYLVKTLAEIL